MAAPVPLTPPVDMPAVDEADEDDVDEDQVDEDLQRVLRRLEQEGEQDGDVGCGQKRGATTRVIRR